MGLSNFTSSGFSFSKDEYHLKSKFKMLNWIIVIIMFFTALFGVMSDMGLNDLGPIHTKVNYLLSLSCIILFFLLRAKKSNFFLVANLLIFVNYFGFTSALLFVTDDAFRAIWFILLIFVAYFVSGKTVGWLLSIASILTIIIANDFVNLKLNPLTLNTSLLSIVIGNFIALFYTNKINEYESFMHKENKELNLLASTDCLTGIMNQRIFNEVSNQYFEIAKQHGHDMSLLVLDIDNFKVVNDTHGHPAGDAVLVQFANVVQSLLRKNDIYARVGGEEFAILLFKINLEDAYLLAEKLRTLIEVIDLEYKDQIINLSTSIGVVQIKEEDQDFEALFNRADKALYEAKQNGRNQTVKGY